MKNLIRSTYGLFAVLAVCLLMICLFAPLKAQPTTPPPVNPNSLFITEATTSAFMIQTYNRILIGTWFEMKNTEAKEGSSVSIADYPMFAPEKVRVTVKAEPTVEKKDDGTWAITFKEIKP